LLGQSQLTPFRYSHNQTYDTSQVVGVDEIVGQHGDLTDYSVKVDSRQIEEAHFSGAPT